MNITIYAIGGKWQSGDSGDCLIGKAYDTLTFLSLIDLVELKGGYAVSLHGDLWGDGFKANFYRGPFSGEYTLTAARNLVKILEKVA